LFVVSGGQVHIVDCQAHRARAEPFGERILAITLSPVSKTLLAGGADKAARLWDPAVGRPIGPMMRHDGVVVGVAFSRDGASLATVTAAGRVRFWDAATRKPIGPDLEHVDWVTRFGWDDRAPLAFTPDGRALVTAGNGVVLWPVPAAAGADRAGLIAGIPSLTGLRSEGPGDPQRLSPTEWSRAVDEQTRPLAPQPDPIA
jgi:hypothetical protein